jgi:hypothetical protein
LIIVGSKFYEASLEEFKQKNKQIHLHTFKEIEDIGGSFDNKIDIFFILNLNFLNFFQRQHHKKHL